MFRDVKISSAMLCASLFAFFLTSGFNAFSSEKTYSEWSQFNPSNFNPDHTYSFTEGDIRVVIGDGHPHGGSERDIYPGIHHLSHKLRPSNVFNPWYAGEIGANFGAFRSQRKIELSGDNSAILYYGEGLSRISKEYTVIAPHYIDCTARFARRGARASMASFSYTNGPADPAMYMIRKDGRWMRHYSEIPGDRGSVAPSGRIETPRLFRAENPRHPHGNNNFHGGFSDLRFDSDYPLFYGLMGDGMVLVFMIEPRWRNEVVFFMNPGGGGYSSEFHRRNPAWDYSVNISSVPAEEEAVVRTRIIYKKFVSRQDILEEYENWSKELQENKSPVHDEILKNVQNNITEDIHEAAVSGSLQALKTFIESGEEIDRRTPLNWTPLHMASFAGRNEVVEFLIKNGADINAKTERNRTPLHIATASANTETARILLELGAEPNPRNLIEGTPLHTASFAGFKDIVMLLIENGADLALQDFYGRTALHWAVYGENPKIAEMLIEKGAAINHEGKGQRNLSGDVFFTLTPLGSASFLGHTETMELLIERGADVNFMAGTNPRALYCAVLGGHADAVKILLNNGANVNERQPEGPNFSALHRAVFDGSYKIVKILLENGAEINDKDSIGWTPLHWAYEKRREDIVNLLKEHGACINAEDSEIKGSIQLPLTWRIFGPVERSDALPPKEILSSYPEEIEIGGKTLKGMDVEVKDGIYDFPYTLKNEDPEKTAYAFLSFMSKADQKITLGMGANWWMQAWLNGDIVLDTTETGNIYSPFTIWNHMITAQAKKGNNVLAVRLIRGGSSILALGGPDRLKVLPELPFKDVDKPRSVNQDKP